MIRPEITDSLELKQKYTRELLERPEIAQFMSVFPLPIPPQNVPMVKYTDRDTIKTGEKKLHTYIIACIKKSQLPEEHVTKALDHFDKVFVKKTEFPVMKDPLSVYNTARLNYQNLYEEKYSWDVAYHENARFGEKRGYELSLAECFHHEFCHTVSNYQLSKLRVYWGDIQQGDLKPLVTAAQEGICLTLNWAYARNTSFKLAFEQTGSFNSADVLNDLKKGSCDSYKTPPLVGYFSFFREYTPVKKVTENLNLGYTSESAIDFKTVYDHIREKRPEYNSWIERVQNHVGKQTIIRSWDDDFITKMEQHQSGKPKTRVIDRISSGFGRLFS